MRFGDFLTERGILMAAAATDLGCSEGHVSRLAAGVSDPSMDFARKVAAWSKGAVTPSDWPEPAAKAA